MIADAARQGEVVLQAPAAATAAQQGGDDAGEAATAGSPAGRDPGGVTGGRAVPTPVAGTGCAAQGAEEAVDDGHGGTPFPSTRLPGIRRGRHSIW